MCVPVSVRRSRTGTRAWPTSLWRIFPGDGPSLSPQVIGGSPPKKSTVHANNRRALTPLPVFSYRTSLPTLMDVPHRLHTVSARPVRTAAASTPHPVTLELHRPPLLPMSCPHPPSYSLTHTHTLLGACCCGALLALLALLAIAIAIAST
jgi:hypothetical protein